MTKSLAELEEDYGKEMVMKIVGMFIPDSEARLARIDEAVKLQDFKELEEPPTASRAAPQISARGKWPPL